jgi:hypothetical protein
MLVRYLARQPARLSREEIERRHALVAQALIEHHEETQAALTRRRRERLRSRL